MQEPLKIKEEVLDKEFKKWYEEKIMLEFEIALQGKLDPDEISAKKPLKYASNGQVISSQDITRKEYIEIKTIQLDAVNLKLETIKELYGDTTGNS